MEPAVQQLELAPAPVVQNGLGPERLVRAACSKPRPVAAVAYQERGIG